jgi:UDP-glucose 4-epimerase
VKCLVLGGGGFIGLNLCEGLLAAGHQVRVFERPRLTIEGASAPAADDTVKGVEWLEGDFANRADVDAAVSGCDIVFHLICTTLPGTSNDNPAYDIESNVISTIRLLDAARAMKVKKVVFISSGGTVYGIPTTLPIPEDHPTAPICSYGITKLAVEHYLHLYHYLHGLDYCILRLGNPYGERQRAAAAQGAVGVFLHHALKHEPIEIWGDGGVVRDYVYIGDVVSAFVKTIDYTGDVRTFNIGSGRGASLNELVETIESLLGRSITRVEKRARPVDVPINVLDIAKARTFLAWEPRTSLREGLTRTVDWINNRGVNRASGG